MKFEFICTAMLLVFQLTLQAQNNSEDYENSADESSLAENKPVFSGYIENTLTGGYDEDDEAGTAVNYSRARVNVEGRYGNNADYAVGLVGTLYSGSAETDMTSMLPERIRSSLTPYAGPLFTVPAENDIYLQEAFLTLYSSFARLRLGRQKYYTGSGYAYNPSDFFNRKNPLDPAYETDGIDGVLLSVSLPADAVLEGFYRPGKDVAASDYQACIKLALPSTDAVLQYTWFNQERSDFEAMDADGANILLGQSQIDDYKTLYGMHFAGGSISSDLFGIGLRAEGGYLMQGNRSGREISGCGGNYEVFLAGADYTFEMQLYVILEYYRNGAGLNSENNAGFNEAMSYLAGESDSIVKDTIFAGMSYPLTDLADASLYVIGEVSDGNVIFNPAVNWSVFNSSSLEFAGIIPAGNKGSVAYAAGYGGYMRAKVSF